MRSRCHPLLAALSHSTTPTPIPTPIPPIPYHHSPYHHYHTHSHTTLIPPHTQLPYHHSLPLFVLQIEQEVEGIREAHRILEASTQRREGLEKALRIKLEQEIRRIKEENISIKGVLVLVCTCAPISCGVDLLEAFCGSVGVHTMSIFCVTS